MSDKSKKEDYTIYPLLRDPDAQEYQEVGENLLKPSFVYGLIGTRFVGKCFGIDTPIKMFDKSIKKVQDIKVGDKLLGDDEEERIVESVCEGVEQMYIVKQEGGITYRVNKSHILSLINEESEKIDINIEEYLQSDLYLYGYKIVDGVIIKGCIKIIMDKVDNYYGFEISGNNRRFKLEDDTIVHNTNLMMTMVMRGFPFYLGAFDRIILISGTMKFDSSTRALVDYIGSENAFDTYSDGIIQALVEHNKALPKQLREKILIIGDDLPSLNLPMNAEIYKGTAYFRHLGISVILITQILRGVGQGLPPIVRNQLEGICIFRNSNQKQLNNIFEEMGHFGSPENIEAMYNDVVRGVPYNFLYLNSRTLKCYKNFDEEIWSMYDENGNYNPPYVEFKNKNKKKSLIENGSTSSEIIPK